MTQANQALKKHQQRGFTLIEAMIAMVVLTIGMCGVIATLATAITATASAQEDLVARHKALEAMESIYAARNSQQVPFAQINNVANGGIFLGGAQQLQCAGPDGILGRLRRLGRVSGRFTHSLYSYHKLGWSAMEK